MASFNSVTPNELAVLADLIAIALSEGKSANENNVLGNLLVAIGSIVLTIAAQQQNVNSLEDKKKQIDDLQKQLKQLKDSL